MKKHLLKALGFAAVVLGMTVYQLNWSDNAQRDAFAKYIMNHPYQNREVLSKSDIKSIPKKDRPDLAFEREYLLTMDPKTKTVPSERLFPIFEYVNKKKKAFQSNKALPGTPTTKWEERGPSNVGGRTRAIMFDPNDAQNLKVWAGGVGGGLWYTNDITNNNAGWNNVDDFWASIAISCMAYDPTNTQVFYVGTGEGWYNGDAQRGSGVWKTTDGGANWSQLSATTGSDYRFILDIQVTNSGVLLVATRSGLYRSANGGTSFTYELNGPVGDLEMGADNTLYATRGTVYSSGSIHKSTDEGLNWTSISGSNGFPSVDVERIELATAPSNANVLYAMYQDGNSFDVGGIYKSTNKGASWTSLPLPVWDGGDNFARGQAWYDMIIGVDPTNENRVYIGGVDLFRSTNGGSSWTQLTNWYLDPSNVNYAHADQHAMAFRPGNNLTVLHGNDGGLSITFDGGENFETRVSGYNVTQFYSCAIAPAAGASAIVGGAQDNGSQFIKTSGLQPATEVNGGDGAFSFIDQTGDNIMLTSSQNGNYSKHDLNGNYLGEVIGGSQGSFINPGDYDDKLNILYSAIDNSTTSISRVRNVTGNPIEETINTNLGAEISHIRVSPYSPVGTTTLFVGIKSGGAYKITNAHNGLASTTGLNIPGTGAISCIEVGASENELLVTFSNYGITSVYYTSNGGGTWISKEGNLPDMPVRWALFNPKNRNEVILATEVGVWGTYDLSAASPVWEPHVNGLANTRVDMLQMRDSDAEVVAATHGRGLFTSSGFNGVTPVLADFIADQTDIKTGQTVNFTDESTGSPTSWLWTFTGGTPSSFVGQTPPSITYNTDGCFDVQLIVARGGEADTLKKTCYINVSLAPPCGEIMSFDVDNNPVVNPTDAGSFLINYIDEDQNPVPADLAIDGWTSNWHIVTQTSGNKVLGALSWFDPPGQASNWVVMGPLTLGSAAGTISWKHGFNDNAYRDGYEVIVNNNGMNISDFTALSATKLASYIDNDPRTDGQIELNAQSVDIPLTYANQQVYIAFHHTANDQIILYLDDIVVESCSVPGPPVADFESDVQVVPVGGLVDFTDKSTNGPTSWLWNFGGGNGSVTDRNPQNVQFNTEGCYTVSLTSTNAAGSSTETKTCYIEAVTLPVSDFKADTLYIPVGGSVNFTDLSTNSPDAWSWTFEGATTTNSNLQNPSGITYNNKGCFEVSLTSSKKGVIGSQITRTCYITVIETPVANFRSYKRVIAVGDTINFTDLTSGSVDAWSWSFPGSVQATSNDQHPIGIQYNNPGSYNVTLTATIMGMYPSTEIKELYITVVQPATADFKADTTTIWEGETVNFTDLSSNNPDSWKWTFPGSLQGSSTAQNPGGILYNASGCYEVSLEVATKGYIGGIETKTCYIDVWQKPVANFSANKTLVSVGESVDFSDQSTGKVNSWTWTFEGADQTSSTDQNPVGITYSSSGKYAVELTVSYDGNMSNTKTMTSYIEVIVAPEAAFSASTTEIYMGESVDFTDLSTGDVDGWSWTFDGASTSSSLVQNPQGVVYPDSGCYEVVLTASYAGEYPSTETKTCYINVLSNVSAVELNDQQIQVYPNPAKDFIRIKGVSENSTYELLNSMGQVVQTGRILSDEYQLDISDLPTGNYFIKVLENEAFVIKEIVVTN